MEQSNIFISEKPDFDKIEAELNKDYATGGKVSDHIKDASPYIRGGEKIIPSRTVSPFFFKPSEQPNCLNKLFSGKLYLIDAYWMEQNKVMLEGKSMDEIQKIFFDYLRSNPDFFFPDK